MVTDDASVAMELLASGVDVVLVITGDSGATPAPMNHSGRTAGRLAVMVGDTSDPATMAAAREMDAELFNSRR